MAGGSIKKNYAWQNLFVKQYTANTPTNKDKQRKFQTKSK
jgi:hypothetical protein